VIPVTPPVGICVVVGLCFLMSPSAGYAQVCPPSSPQSSGPLGETPAIHFVQGMSYLRANCLGEARRSLEQARRLETGEPNTRVALALRLIGAKENLATGRSASAERELRSIVREPPGELVAMSVELLSQLLQGRDDDPDWPYLEAQLADLAVRGYYYADLLLQDHRTNRLGPAKAALELQQTLAKENRPQRVLTLRVLLSDLYVRSDRMLDAALLISSIEKDVGTKLLDLRARQRFLEVGVRVWGQLVRDGRSELTSRFDAYVTALAELKQVSGR
jgi:hypothetical protein